MQGFISGKQIYLGQWFSFRCLLEKTGMSKVFCAVAVIIAGGIISTSFYTEPANAQSLEGIIKGFIQDVQRSTKPRSRTIRRSSKFEKTLSRSQRINIQTQLNELGYNVGNPDGAFGRNTRRGIRRFQVDRGFRSTGYLTRKQATILQNSSGETGVASRSTSDSDTSPDDRKLTSKEMLSFQRSLNVLGYSAGKANGKVSRKTGRAVSRFLRDRGYDPETTSPLFALKLAEKESIQIVAAKKPANTSGVSSSKSQPTAKIQFHPFFKGFKTTFAIVAQYTTDQNAKLMSMTYYNKLYLRNNKALCKKEKIAAQNEFEEDEVVRRAEAAFYKWRDFLKAKKPYPARYKVRHRVKLGEYSEKLGGFTIGPAKNYNLGYTGTKPAQFLSGSEQYRKRGSLELVLGCFSSSHKFSTLWQYSSLDVTSDFGPKFLAMNKADAVQLIDTLSTSRTLIVYTDFEITKTNFKIENAKFMRLEIIGKRIGAQIFNPKNKKFVRKYSRKDFERPGKTSIEKNKKDKPVKASKVPSKTTEKYPAGNGDKKKPKPSQPLKLLTQAGLREIFLSSVSSRQIADTALSARLYGKFAPDIDKAKCLDLIKMSRNEITRKQFFSDTAEKLSKLVKSAKNAVRGKRYKIVYEGRLGKYDLRKKAFVIRHGFKKSSDEYRVTSDYSTKMVAPATKPKQPDCDIREGYFNKNGSNIALRWSAIYGGVGNPTQISVQPEVADSIIERLANADDFFMEFRDLLRGRYAFSKSRLGWHRPTPGETAFRPVIIEAEYEIVSSSVANDTTLSIKLKITNFKIRDAFDGTTIMDTQTNQQSSSEPATSNATIQENAPSRKVASILMAENDHPGNERVLTRDKIAGTDVSDIPFYSAYDELILNIKSLTSQQLLNDKIVLHFASFLDIAYDKQRCKGAPKLLKNEIHRDKFIENLRQDLKQELAVIKASTPRTIFRHKFAIALGRYDKTKSLFPFSKSAMPIQYKTAVDWDNAFIESFSARSLRKCYFGRGVIVEQRRGDVQERGIPIKYNHGLENIPVGITKAKTFVSNSLRKPLLPKYKRFEKYAPGRFVILDAVILLTGRIGKFSRYDYKWKAFSADIVKVNVIDPTTGDVLNNYENNYWLDE